MDSGRVDCSLQGLSAGRGCGTRRRLNFELPSSRRRKVSSREIITLSDSDDESKASQLNEVVELFPKVQDDSCQKVYDSGTIPVSQLPLRLTGNQRRPRETELRSTGNQPRPRGREDANEIMPKEARDYHYKPESGEVEEGDFKDFNKDSASSGSTRDDNDINKDAASNDRTHDCTMKTEDTSSSDHDYTTKSKDTARSDRTHDFLVKTQLEESDGKHKYEDSNKEEDHDEDEDGQEVFESDENYSDEEESDAEPEYVGSDEMKRTGTPYARRGPKSAARAARARAAKAITEDKFAEPLEVDMDKRVFRCKNKNYCYSPDIFCQILKMPNAGLDMKEVLSTLGKKGIRRYFGLGLSDSVRKYNVADFRNFGSFEKEQEAKVLMRKWNRKLHPFYRKIGLCNKSTVVAAMTKVSGREVNYPKYMSDYLHSRVSGGSLRREWNLCNAVMNFHDKRKAPAFIVPQRVSHQIRFSVLEDLENQPFKDVDGETEGEIDGETEGEIDVVGDGDGHLNVDTDEHGLVNVDTNADGRVNVDTNLDGDVSVDGCVNVDTDLDGHNVHKSIGERAALVSESPGHVNLDARDIEATSMLPGPIRLTVENGVSGRNRPGQGNGDSETKEAAFKSCLPIKTEVDGCSPGPKKDEFSYLDKQTREKFEQAFLSTGRQLEEVLSVCRNNREKLVHDQKELIREINLQEGVESMLQRNLQSLRDKLCQLRDKDRTATQSIRNLDENITLLENKRRDLTIGEQKLIRQQKEKDELMRRQKEEGAELLNALFETTKLTKQLAIPLSSLRKD